MYNCNVAVQLCSDQLHKVVFAIYMHAKSTLRSLVSVLAHHLTALFAHCIAMFIKLCTVAVLSVSGAHVSTAICIILYPRTYIWGLSQKGIIIILVVQLQWWYCIEAPCYDMKSLEASDSDHSHIQQTYKKLQCYHDLSTKSWCVQNVDLHGS